MELPSRPEKDRFAPTGRFQQLCREISQRPGVQDIPTLLITAFDFRTRMLPFLTADSWIIPAGIRAVSAALSNAGFQNQRTVNQAWTPNVLPSNSRLNGKIPELLLVSSMQIHAGRARDVIRDAWTLGQDRPLIIAGGPKAIYQPWDFFRGDSPNNSPDIVCTGEEFVLMELLDRLFEMRGRSESLRTAFERARKMGSLEDIPGLMFEAPDRALNERELIDTGVQRLVRDFDELPSLVEGYKYIEPPHKKTSIGASPLELKKVSKYCKIASITTTRGCKFRCSYCPIPAYNQFSFRTRSPERLVADIREIRKQVGIHYFFGTDDNFFNDEAVVAETFEALAKADFKNDEVGKSIRFGTEATIFDVHKQVDILPLAYAGGLRAIWFGIEDLTAELINKGQNVGKTEEIFTRMRENRILPMAMMMHYEGQPLKTKDSMQGILNQVKYLYSIGAGSIQVTVLSPGAGNKDYKDVMERGIILKSIENEPVEDCIWDGNHVFSGGVADSWKLQRNMMLAYATFYNPINLAKSFFRKHRKWSDFFLQLWGMYGVLITVFKLVPWMFKVRRALRNKNYTVWKEMPQSEVPIRPSAEAFDDSSIRTDLLPVIEAPIAVTCDSHSSTSPPPAKAKPQPARRATLSKY